MLEKVSSYKQEVYATPADSTQNQRVLVAFALENEWYAADIKHVCEIIPLPSLTPLPNVPRSVLGVINLRGLILSIIYLKSCLGLESEEFQEKGQVVVVKNKGITSGFLVDGATEILNIPAEKIEDLMPLLAGKENHFLEGQVEWQGKLIGLLDIPKVLEKTSLSHTEASS